MRRISRLRQLPGINSSSPRASISTSADQCRSQPTSSEFASVSHPRPVRTSLRNHISTRFYSADRTTTQKSTAPAVDVARGEERSELDGDGLEVADYRRSYTYVPPPPRSYAERSDEVSDPYYVPALKGDDLETVGGMRYWWEQPDHWNNDFAGFRPSRTVLDPAVIEASVRRAVVEAFALRQAGREDDLVRAWPMTGGELSRLMGVDVHVGEDGAMSFTGDASFVLETLSPKDLLNTNDESAGGQSLNKSILSVKEAQAYREAWGQGWKAASLSEPRIRFAVTKRVFQLTGQLVRDHQLASITDVRSLLGVLQKPPKPKTVTQEIQEHRQDLVQLPNVSVATKRVTRGHKEKAVGRFKLIEEELKKRDLPLVGHGYARKNRELSQFKGGV
ncbi:hypothetical protein GGR52DRAFT_369579 [Hypoxylon sp. FL1284]|nr:hypothetical protein GGR52DRAFT_369579 [Hypoxylon sp. FL1284]